MRLWHQSQRHAVMRSGGSFATKRTASHTHPHGSGHDEEVAFAELDRRFPTVDRDAAAQHHEPPVLVRMTVPVEDLAELGDLDLGLVDVPEHVRVEGPVDLTVDGIDDVQLLRGHRVWDSWVRRGGSGYRVRAGLRPCAVERASPYASRRCGTIACVSISGKRPWGVLNDRAWTDAKGTGSRPVLPRRPEPGRCASRRAAVPRSHAVRSRGDHFPCADGRGRYAVGVRP